MAQARDLTATVRTAETDRISQTVVFAVAEARNLSPTELGTPLFEAIDPDALDRLLSGRDRSGAASVRVQFDWAGCSVVVNDTGQVEVTVNRPAER